MNITLLTPKLSLFNQNSKNNRPSLNYSEQISNNLAPLNADTVSFTGKVPRKTTNSITDFLEKQFVRKIAQLSDLADDFLNASEIAARKLNHLGFSIDREYCDLNPVKSKNSYISKIKRSKVLKVPDTIRDTVYCNDPYDLSKLDLWLKEMENQGYVVAPTDMKVLSLMKRGYVPTEEINALGKYLNGSKTQKSLDKLLKMFKAKGYDTAEVQRMLTHINGMERIPNNSEMLEMFGKLSKEVPDLDIRLDDVKDKLYLLPEKYQYNVGQPQKSGYEDIQIRFVRKSSLEGKKRSLELHEMIILFGEKYAQAKHRESERVYSNLRGFGELNITKYFDNQRYESMAKVIKAYISEIETLFRSEISIKEFANAKASDYLGIEEDSVITFTKRDEAKFESAFDKLMMGLQLMYEKLQSRANSRQKTVLHAKEQEDISALSEIRNGLKNTIKTYQKEGKEKSVHS